MTESDRIMLVDDDFDIIFVVRQYLERWGFEVDTFTNPLYALQKFKENPGRYSLLLTDIRMPEMTGIRLTKLVQEIKPSMKAVIMTAYELTPEDLNEQMPSISRDDILQKPFRLLQICRAVKKQLQTAKSSRETAV